MCSFCRPLVEGEELQQLWTYSTWWQTYAPSPAQLRLKFFLLWGFKTQSVSFFCEVKWQLSQKMLHYWHCLLSWFGHLVRMPPIKGGPGTSIRANVPGQAQDSLEGFWTSRRKWMDGIFVLYSSFTFIYLKFPSPWGQPNISTAQTVWASDLIKNDWKDQCFCCIIGFGLNAAWETY